MKNPNQLTTIRLYGTLGARFGRVHRMAVSSAAEAVTALCTQLAGFERVLTEAKDRGYGFSVFYGKQNLDKDELLNPSMGDDIRIAPMLFGRKSGGWFNVIVGVVLIAVGAVINFYTGGTMGNMFIKMGAGLIVGGVVQMLAPAPRGMASQDRPENTPSYAFNGAVNTSAQGHPVMVVYGEVITGSAVLSAGINSVDQAYVPGTPGAGSGGGGGGGAPAWHDNYLQEV